MAGALGWGGRDAGRLPRGVCMGSGLEFKASALPNYPSTHSPPLSSCQVEIAPHYYSKKEIMEQANKKLPKQLGKAAEVS